VIDEGRIGQRLRRLLPGRKDPVQGTSGDPLEASRKRPFWLRGVRLGAGAFLVVLGIVLIPLPGPGLLIVIGGLALLAEDVPLAERLLHWCKRRAEEAKDRVLAAAHAREHTKAKRSPVRGRSRQGDAPFGSTDKANDDDLFR